MITSAKDVVGLCVRDSVKCPTLSPFQNAPANIFWLGLFILIVSSLKQARYSLRDSYGPLWILKMLETTIFLCVLVANWWTSFFTKSWWASDGESRKTHIPLSGCFSNCGREELVFHGGRDSKYGHLCVDSGNIFIWVIAPIELGQRMRLKVL